MSKDITEVVKEKITRETYRWIPQEDRDLSADEITFAVGICVATGIGVWLLPSYWWIAALMVSVGAFCFYRTGGAGVPSFERLLDTLHFPIIFKIPIAVVGFPVWFLVSGIRFAFLPMKSAQLEEARFTIPEVPEPEPEPPELFLPSPQRFSGTWIVAGQGKGKTTLLSHFLLKDLLTTNSVIVFDPKDDIIPHLQQWEGFADNDKLVLLEPDANLAINLLDLGASTGHTIELIEYVFAALLDIETTPYQGSTLRSAILLCKAIPDANLSTLRRVLQDGHQPFAQYLPKLHAEDQQFFLRGTFDKSEYKKRRDELEWRIRDLTTRIPMLRDSFAAPATKLNLAKEIDAGKLILINNSIEKLGIKGAEFFGRFFIALILGVAYQRAGRQQSNKRPCYVYLDEADLVIKDDPKVAEIIHRCRSQNIGMVLAHQEFEQIKSPDVRGALSNCAIRIANVDAEANKVAYLLNVPREQVTLPVGEFFMAVRDGKSERISPPDNPVKQWPKMMADDFQAIRKKMRERYSYVPHLTIVQGTDDDPPSSPQPKQ